MLLAFKNRLVRPKRSENRTPIEYQLKTVSNSLIFGHFKIGPFDNWTAFNYSIVGVFGSLFLLNFLNLDGI